MATDERRSALVTGGSAGIGLAIAQRFRGLGLRVMVTGRTPDSLEQARRALGDEAHVVASDAGVLADIDALRAVVVERLGTLDVLVANAGTTMVKPFAELSEHDVDSTFAVNARGPLFTVQRLAPLLRDGAAVVLTTSVGDGLGRPRYAAYDASKAALRSLTRSLAAELLPRGIRVNAISPGYIGDTKILGRTPRTAEERAEVHRRSVASTPMGRAGTLEEIADAAEFLALRATFTTGAELPVDGGWSQL